MFVWEALVWDRVSYPVIERSSILLAGGGRNARLPFYCSAGVLAATLATGKKKLETGVNYADPLGQIHR